MFNKTFFLVENEKYKNKPISNLKKKSVILLEVEMNLYEIYRLEPHSTWEKDAFNNFASINTRIFTYHLFLF